MSESADFAMNTSKVSPQDWGKILEALEAKTKEIQARGEMIADKQDGGDPYAEAARWATHVRRIIDEIALFMRGE